MKIIKIFQRKLPPSYNNKTDESIDLNFLSSEWYQDNPVQFSPWLWNNGAKSNY